MGQLFDQFKDCTFSNEAEVSQKFILPLLTGYLGYRLAEIIPERIFPAKDLYSGVNFSAGGSKGLNHRPDFVVCMDGDLQNARFIIDSKGPAESLDSHLGQLRSYANSVGRNFIMITNGKALQIFDVNNLIFHSKDMEDLQLKLDELIKLLGRKNQNAKSAIEILQTLDLEKSVSISEKTKIDDLIRRRRIQLSDFAAYFKGISSAYQDWHLPSVHFRAIDNLDIKGFDPTALLSFRSQSETEEVLDSETELKFAQIENMGGLSARVIVGETGTGKTSLLKFLALRSAECASALLDTKIPVYVALKEIGFGYTLEQLIMAALRRYGYRGDSFEALVQDHQFVFFFDAFDELAQQFRIEVCQAISNLCVHHECYLTTRPNVIPRIGGSARFNISALRDAQVEEISKFYLTDQYYDFQHQLEVNGLINESRNILLLLFLLALYKQNGRMPQSVSKIISAITARAAKWNDDKLGKKNSISWRVLSGCLGEIAYEICATDSSSLSHGRAAELLSGFIIEQEQRRMLAVGTTVDTMLIALEETGLLIANNDHLYFWHRLFLNHFAGLALTTRFCKENSSLENLVMEERWEVPIISMCSALPEISAVIAMLKKRLWLAAYCLSENPVCSQGLKDQVIAALAEKTGSPVSGVRKRAVSYLQSIADPKCAEILLGLFNTVRYDDVTMMALPAIARTAPLRARKIIDAHIDWDESDFFQWRSSQSYVTEALSYYGEEGYLQIAGNWGKFSHAPFNYTCKKLFLRYFAAHEASLALKTELQALYMKELSAGHKYGEKVEAIAEVLSMVDDADFAIGVLDYASKNKIEFSKLRSVSTILKSATAPRLAEEIKTVLLREGNDRYLTDCLAKALRESAAVLPQAFYLEMTSSTNVPIATSALERLGNYPFESVREEIYRHLYADQPQMQQRALELLVNNGKFIELIREKKFPSPFYTPTAHTLLKGVRKFHLIEALPLLVKVQTALADEERYVYESPLAFELAGTFYLLGSADRQREIISWYFDGNVFLQKEDHLHSNLMRKAKFFEPELAEALVGCYYRTYLDEIHADAYELEVFVETAEGIGGLWMREKLKEITARILLLIGQSDKYPLHRLERLVRAMVKIGRPEDEDWLLGILGQLESDEGGQYAQLRRAIEFLACHGSLKSLPVILEIGNRHLPVEGLVDSCQHAYNSICSRNKVPIGDGDAFGPVITARAD
ncbi:type I restriction enzyme HsdR N-terminal domain-containing protein [Pedobacter sp. BMA]|uniref:type I restriction enzyme HsdR N-terminal domain-containing protein n=1 Tax=Pedobacter sp. BMA TaxID=1663685 RepID=UPI00064B2F84|nr:type I restriction enzyme HsdR N-terminal domain-containing protein [Pedobacter sp. BMA]KLT63931.1 hypothetical protein AB669_19585 [Pedobacter sp. BMA]